VLYLHIGLPRTGTTSLQTVLARSAAPLAATNTVYPERWRDGGNLAHHELASGLLAGETGLAVQDDFLRYVAEKGKRTHVIISTEGFSNGLAPSKFHLFRSFLRACSSWTPVRVVLTLRRYDMFVSSMYHHQLKWGQEPDLDIDRYARLRQSWISGVFKGLSDLRRDSDVASLVLIPYVEGSDSIAPALDALGVSPLLLRPRPPARLGRSIGLKALVLLRFLNEWVTEHRLPVERRHVVQLFERREFEFRNEEYAYDILGYDARQALHEHALSAAAEHGITEYHGAYRDAVIERTVRQAVDRGLISAEDLDELGRYLAERRPAPHPAARRGRLPKALPAPRDS
jgi:hypothetical protein